MGRTTTTRITVVGGGLGGALMAVYLGRAGFEVDLYERRPDPESGQKVGGRSINLAISTRGLHALAEVGLADEVLKSAVPMRGRMIHDIRGGLHYQPYDKDPDRYINSIGRGLLNDLTISAAKKFSGVRVHFNHKCTDVDLDRPAAHFERLDTHETVEKESDVVLGVDGAFSAVRRSMQRLERFDYSQHYLEHGYKELCIPPDTSGGFRMEREALHIWPRHSFMMIALPNFDGSYTCTLFFPFEGPMSFTSLRTDDDVKRFFHTQFPDAVPLMPTLLEDFNRNPTGSMVTVRCSPWHVGGKVALLGDAAHAVVPFYGQGANASFEDCTVLNACIARHAPDWERIFDEYESMRVENANVLADLAIGNFIEMRDKTSSAMFRWYKKFDRTMHKWMPWWYTPLYTMVSFTRIPYARAVERARWQNGVLAAAGCLLAVGLALLIGLVQGRTAYLLLLVGFFLLAVAYTHRDRSDAESNDLRKAGARL